MKCRKCLEKWRVIWWKDRWTQDTKGKIDHKAELQRREMKHQKQISLSSECIEEERKEDNGSRDKDNRMVAEVEGWEIIFFLRCSMTILYSSDVSKVMVQKQLLQQVVEESRHLVSFAIKTADWYSWNLPFRFVVMFETSVFLGKAITSLFSFLFINLGW